MSILKSSKSFTKSPLYNVWFANTKQNRCFWKIGYSSRVSGKTTIRLVSLPINQQRSLFRFGSSYRQ
ncbi:hypothetical protein HanPSC8_Chr04g0185621 [Helianthus annuus]|nr:hypothetical protein HanPSC8_Chr04g0185621 [Helianthus annuus]